ncbi:MAG: endonuclease/exonuclease/phosphatase family protein [Bacteroidales bacterium]|nr:endonuclease/exonuclease/phosphatase family protein [Bacteroidales bacterium]
MKKLWFTTATLVCAALLMPSCFKSGDNSLFVRGPETANFNSGVQMADEDKDQQEGDEIDWESIDIVPEQTSDSEVKAMSFNVRVIGDRGNNAWDVRKKGIPVMVRTINPTVIGVQEAQPAHLNYLSSNLPEYAYVGDGRDGGAKGEHTAIFYKTDEVQLMQSGTFWLSETPNQVSYGWSAQYRRIATWAIFKKSATGEFFFHMNTHLDFAVDVVTNEMYLIADKMREYNPQGYPGVFTGDMNTTQGSPVFDVIRTAGWKSARSEARDTDNSITFNGFGASGAIIDHVFFNKFTTSKFKVVNEKYNGVQYLSDHYPVYAVLGFPLK